VGVSVRAMNTSDRYRVVFFHVPKTAGRTISSLPWWDEQTGHMPYPCEREIPTGYASFAVVRNPWDRLVSAWAWMLRQQPGLCERDFRRFVLGFPTWAHRDRLPFIRQTVYLTDDWGRLIPGWLLRFENLQEDVDTLSARLGAPQQRLPRLNASDHPPYREMYDDRTRAIVGRCYAGDVERFGYTF